MLAKAKIFPAMVGVCEPLRLRVEKATATAMLIGTWPFCVCSSVSTAFENPVTIKDPFASPPRVSVVRLRRIANVEIRADIGIGRADIPADIARSR